MNIYTLREDDLGNTIYKRIYLLIETNPKAWQSIGAALGLIGGLFSIIFGTFVWAMGRFVAPGNFGTFLHVLGIVFFALPFPLLGLGAHCLDLLEKKPLHRFRTESPTSDFGRGHRLQASLNRKN